MLQNSSDELTGDREEKIWMIWSVEAFVLSDQ